MKRNEAELILFWRQLLAGEFPPLVRRLAGASPEAGAMLANGLARLVVRYLLAQGGAHPDESLTDDRRISRRALWSQPQLAIDLRQPMFMLLANLAARGKPQPEPIGDLGAGGEVALLMIADDLARRPRPDLTLQTIAACGALAWLVHGCEGDRALPAGTDFEDALFFARGRLASAWLELDPLLGRSSPSLGMPAVLARADQRARVWARYRERVLHSRRFDLLAPMCSAATSMWTDTQADALMLRVEELGRFSGESPRQEAYRRLLAAYQWMGDLEDWAAQARPIGPYDEEHYRWQVYLAYYGRMPESTHHQSTRLLAQLRRTL